MRGRSDLLRAAVSVLAICLISGCTVLNNEFIRVRRNNPDVTRTKLKAPNFVGPRERVDRFLHYYKNKDWKSMESALDVESDLRSLRDQVQADFDIFGDMEIDLKIEPPIFNDAQDKAQIRVHFEMEKIDSRTGSLILQNGSGLFVLTAKGNWDILGYIGDPFWGEGKKKRGKR